MDDPYEPPKSELREPLVKKLGRTPAQLAFDRCMIVLAGMMVVPIIAASIPDFGLHRIPEGILYAGLIAWWARSLVGVFAVWNEPDARLLRFSGLAVLALSALGIAGLLFSRKLFGLG